jgi:adenylate cyclase
MSHAGTNEIDAVAFVAPVTVMFIDLRNFTALVESQPPTQVVNQLNEYFSVMTRIIVNHDGILDKYMGDAIMAYFECQNPLEYRKAAYNAVSAGIEMMQALEELNQIWQARGWPLLKSGIGINSGPVLKGNIGSVVKQEITIIGDTVNVASRLQELSKTTETAFLISESTYKLVHGEFSIRAFGNVRLRGKKKRLMVYEVQNKNLAHWEDQDDSCASAG